MLYHTVHARLFKKKKKLVWALEYSKKQFKHAEMLRKNSKNLCKYYVSFWIRTVNFFKNTTYVYATSSFINNDIAAEIQNQFNRFIRDMVQI